MFEFLANYAEELIENMFEIIEANSFSFQMIDYGNTSDLDSTVHNFSDFYNDANVYTRTTHRVRKALFPEILLEDDTDEDTGLTTASNSVVGQFAEPSQILKMAILNLLSFKDQLQDAVNNLPQLIQAMLHTDLKVVANAVRQVYLLSKEDKCVVTMASSEPLISALVETINTVDDPDTQRDALATLSHLSQYPAGRLHIFRSGGIAGLIRMLYSSVEAVVHYAVTTLHNLLLYVADVRDEVVGCGGLQAFVPLLQSPNPKLQALVADCLYFLLLDHAQCKLEFLALQGPHLLLDILRSNTNYLKLIYAVVRCLRSISIDQQNKQCLINLGAIETLHQILPAIADGKRRLAVLTAMRNLSDVATNLGTLTGLVVDLIALIASQDDEETIICVCGILSNLTCNNILNKQAVCSTNGILILADVLHRFSIVEDITEPVLCTLRHCTVRHPLAQRAQDELRAEHPIILTLLAGRRPPIVKAALGLVRNCALSQINLHSFIAKKTTDRDTVVSISMEVLEQSGFELQKNFDGVTEGVSLLEMVEGAISALHQLAKEPNVARCVYNHVNIMNILVGLMANEQISNNPDELMMREIVGLIYQLTKTADGAATVKQYGLQPHIIDALSSPHKSITAYASIIMKNMNVDKPIEYGGDHHHHANGSIYGTGTLGSHHNGHAGAADDMGWQNDGLEPEIYNELYNYPSLVDIRHDHIENSARNNTWRDTDL